MKSWVTLLTLLQVASYAQATPVCEAIKAKIPDAKSELRYQNCERILAQNPNINREALEYTFAYFYQNFGKLADPGCLNKKKFATPVYGEESLTKEVVLHGIHNSCIIALNDIKRPHPSGRLRTYGYVFNLCAETNQPDVRQIFFNKGTGSQTGSNADKDGAKTTLAGAFLTASSTFSFQPYKLSPGYENIKAQNLKNRHQSDLVGLRLIGTQSSNNDSYQSKPMHQSPYQSSWGCPSVPPEYTWVMDELASNGPALLMNYGDAKLHQSATACNNDGEMALNTSTPRKANTSGSVQ